MRMTKELQGQLDELWDSKQCARYFNCTTMTISLWVRDYDLPAIQIPLGKRMMFKFVPSEVRHWASRNHRPNDKRWKGGRDHMPVERVRLVRIAA